MKTSDSTSSKVNCPKAPLSCKPSKTWGGRRAGAGRKNKTRAVNHHRRHRMYINRPQHITIRMVDKLPSLRQRWFLYEFQRRARRAKKFNFFVLHFAILGNHLHMIVECKSNRAMELGMRSLIGSLAKTFRARTYQAGYGPKHGSICNGRYFAKPIRTARQMRQTIRYVLMNFAKHKQLIAHIDEFTSAAAFRHWSKLLPMNPLLLEQLEFLKPQDCGLSPPRSWLARRGWREEVGVK
jgi:REP element-mobilizing transposase RayT